MKVSQAEMKAIGRLIRRRREERGLSARQLAGMVGISDAHVFYIEKGLRNPAFDKVMNILGALGVDFGEMLAEIGRGGANIEPARLSMLHQVPVVTLVTAGMWREVCDAFEPGDADEWIETDVQGRNVFALRVTGDSMEPEFSEGEVIIVNPHVEATNGDFVVVKNPEGEATFKQLKKYGGSWYLHPLNPRYEDIELDDHGAGGDGFKIIGRVVKKEKRY